MNIKIILFLYWVPNFTNNINSISDWLENYFADKSFYGHSRVLNTSHSYSFFWWKWYFHYNIPWKQMYNIIIQQIHLCRFSNKIPSSISIFIRNTKEFSTCSPIQSLLFHFLLSYERRYVYYNSFSTSVWPECIWMKNKTWNERGKVPHGKQRSRKVAKSGWNLFNVVSGFSVRRRILYMPRILK